MSPATWVAAVDLGATSVRVCVCDLEAEPLGYLVAHRVAHEPVRGPGGLLRWDWPLIRSAVLDGINRAISTIDRPLASIGIDTWGVDYGLVDGQGRLLADPVSYRDDRTTQYRTLVDKIGERRLYEIAGLQCLPINTIFQLAAEDTDLLSRAARVLTLPELVACELTGGAATGGAMVAETTSAGTTGLVDQATRTWNPELLAAAGVRPGQMPEILPPATPVGTWRGIPVHLVAGHDTGSAVVATPTGAAAAADPAPCFVSSGTWLLAGRELPGPVLTPAAQEAQFTNEYGPEQTTRFLKNIAGFWILEECRRAWGEASVPDLLAEAAGNSAHADTPDVVFDATDPRFLAPADMEHEVLTAAGLPASTPRPTTVNLIVSSLAHTTTSVLERTGELTGHAVTAVHLMGGGVQVTPFVDHLRRHLDHRLGVPLHVGEAESAALGNALVQGIGLGRWSGLAEARAALHTQLGAER